MAQKIEEKELSDLVNGPNGSVLDEFHRLDNIPDVREAKSDESTNMVSYLNNMCGSIDDSEYGVYHLDKPVEEILVIQNGIELPRFKRMDSLTNEAFEELMRNKPIQAIAVRGQIYVINGNHRLLESYLRGYKEVPLVVHAVKRDKGTDLLLMLDNLNRQVNEIFGYNNVNALKKDLCDKIESYSKEKLAEKVA